MNKNIKIGVVGYGYWGPNLARNFSDINGAEVVAICDSDQSRLLNAKKKYPTVLLENNYTKLLQNNQIDAVCLATPVHTHFKLAQAALQFGKHVFVEKPLTAKNEEAEQLITLSQQNKLVLMVDHTFIYTPAVRKIKELIQKNELGELYYYDSTRINLGLFQHDINVLWDLAIHDIAIANYIIPHSPKLISATGLSNVKNSPENIAFMSIFYDKQIIAHINVNWLSPVKVRRTLIGGSKKMILYDDVEPSEKIKVYDKGIDADKTKEGMYQKFICYRTGDAFIPNLDMTEALKTEAQHFIHCINTGEIPQSSGPDGHKCVKILEAATTSMKNNGTPVAL